MLYCVIMGGGMGTRLWPESSPQRPKQFLRFHDEKTLIALAAERVEGLVPRENLLIVTGKAMLPLLRESFPDLSSRQILLEPLGRNTAPCVGWAALHLMLHDPEAVMLVLPADQIITPKERFCDCVSFGRDLLEEDPERLITFGIKPTFPANSYGYIERSQALEGRVVESWQKLTRAFQVRSFHEKPSVEKAEEFIQSGAFLWNAGIFIWKARTIYENLRRYEPEMLVALERILAATENAQSDEILHREFAAMKSVSIDYAVMEKASKIVVIESAFEWDDVGTWRSLERIHRDRHDSSGNLADHARLIAVDASGNIVRSHDPKHLFALIGVENLIVVQTEHATLIAHKDHEESVRNVLKQMETEK